MDVVTKAADDYAAIAKRLNELERKPLATTLAEFNARQAAIIGADYGWFGGAYVPPNADDFYC